MKKVILPLAAFALLFVASCGDDDSDAPGLVNVDPDPTEETALDPSVISGDLIISNGTNITGTPPSPTGNLPFSMSNTTQSAFQKNGFDISFTAPANYAGAYIQLTDPDGGVATDYWDVSGPGRTAITTRERKSLLQGNKSSQDNVEIDVDFEDSVPAGTFCYIICIYDDAGNISEPVEICVEVEAWGGNPNLIGTWNFEKIVENGVTRLVGEADCEDTTVFCNDQSELSIDNAYCFTIVSLPITFNADGSYTYIESAKSTDIDYQQSSETCQAVFGVEEEQSYTSRGNWAYDEEEQKLTLVEFEYIEAAGDDVFEGTEENGYLLVNGDAEITANSLVIKETFTDGDFSENFEIYFNK